jgi:hypothetical protein
MTLTPHIPMNRRHFIHASGLLAASTTLLPAAEADEPLIDWNKITEPSEFTAKCAQFNDRSFPDIQLHVALKPKDPADPAAWWQMRNLLKFDLVWDHHSVIIPGRFWTDLTRMKIQIYPESEQRNVPADKQWKLQQELEFLRQPRLSLSAGKGTVLIEWSRGEECDGRSTFRWMITKTGTVLRHHNLPWHEC